MPVRPARPADGPAYIALVRALAEFEELPGPSDEAAARLLGDAFGERPRYQLDVAELDGEVVGYAVSFRTYSTFLARPTLFLEDLCIHPRARRRGLARELMALLEARARAEGCGRFEWMVLDWNEPALAFYERLGAGRLDSWRLHRKTLSA
jgi:ribosomal protein S18 acetylase RimI-like enzyme